ncbi:hypothetical protein [Candidatus Magnetaquicoccus inordinatus]|uniref:hypothetical protein n=1 Tax=Candidatus Magnetaquicoccus inordinatus TaxID=2496818 RepID=UPI00102D2462|nr:hypothetical protein [Candidatus Magnetaquicoccus inordinatus]
MERDEKYYCYIVLTTIFAYNIYLDVNNINSRGSFDGAFFWMTLFLIYFGISLIAFLSGAFARIIYKRKESLLCHFFYIIFCFLIFIYSWDIHYAKRYIAAKLIYASSYSKCRTNAQKHNKLTICFASVSNQDFDIIAIDPKHELSAGSEFWTSSMIKTFHENKFNIPQARIGPGMTVHHFFDDVYYLYMD